MKRVKPVDMCLLVREDPVAVFEPYLSEDERGETEAEAGRRRETHTHTGIEKRKMRKRNHSFR